MPRLLSGLVVAVRAGLTGGRSAFEREAAAGDELPLELHHAAESQEPFRVDLALATRTSPKLSFTKQPRHSRFKLGSSES